MQEDPEDKIPLRVLGISNASRPDMYALLLAERGGNGRRLPIIIGLPEAQSIAVRLHGLRSPRPLSHDIFMTLALSFQIEMVEAIIYRLVDGVFFSQVVCRQDSKVIYIDSRTSDAVALAIRFNAPIYTYESVLQASTSMAQHSIASLSSQHEAKEEDSPSQRDNIDLQNLDNESLQNLMNKAIEEENYEQASIIRDILNNRK